MATPTSRMTHRRTPYAPRTKEEGRIHTRLQIRLTSGERRAIYTLAKSLDLNVSELLLFGFELLQKSKGVAAAKKTA